MMGLYWLDAQSGLRAFHVRFQAANLLVQTDSFLFDGRAPRQLGLQPSPDGLWEEPPASHGDYDYALSPDDDDAPPPGFARPLSKRGPGGSQAPPPGALPPRPGFAAEAEMAQGASKSWMSALPVSLSCLPVCLSLLA